MFNWHLKPGKWHSVERAEALSDLKADEFENEMHFSNLIEQNIDLVCENIFDGKYVSHKRECPLFGAMKKSLTADFIIQTDRHNILLECKVPKGRGQWAIAQLMKYMVICEKYRIPIDRYVAFVTEHNYYDHQIIKRFNLPFEMYFITRQKVYTIYNGPKQNLGVAG